MLKDIEINAEVTMEASIFYTALASRVLNLKEFRERAGMTQLQRLQETFGILDVSSFFQLLQNQPIIQIDE